MKRSTLVLRDYKNWLLRSFSLILGLLILPSLYAQAATCPSGFISTTLTPADYQQWPDPDIPSNPKIFSKIIKVTGSPNIKNSGLEIVGNMSQRLERQSIGGKASSYPNSGGAFFIQQKIDNATNDSNTITFTSNIPLYNLKLDIYDIDERWIPGDWKDKVIVSGKYVEKNATTTVKPIFKNLGSEVRGSGNELFAASFAKSCENFDADCKATVEFEGPVNEVTLVYTNMLGRTKNQNIEIVFDSFCLGPPKVVVNKILKGNRVDMEDEFKIDIKDGNTNVGGFVTESVNGEFKPGKDRSATLLFTPNKSYTISEAIVGSNQVVKPNAIDNYETTYICTNASTTSKTILPTNGKGSSFTLSNLNYGDDITCSITNTARPYKFSGIVFNDNGGITAVTGAEQNADAPYSTTSEYFDGIFQPSKETGIYEPGLKINLTDCQGNTLDNKIVAVTDNGPNIGQYSITFAKSKMVNAQGQPLNQVCLVELEPDGNLEGYPVDTTKNKLTIPIVSNKFEYSNNNFGEVSQANSALVLQKRQYITQCNSLPDNLSEIPQADDELPTVAFSTMDPLERVPPGHCIVYKITAINRGHVPLTEVIIRDTLQKQLPNGTGVTAYYQTSPATISPNGLSSADGAITESGQNGTITTNAFALVAGQSKSLIFNTKYGLIND